MSKLKNKIETCEERIAKLEGEMKIVIGLQSAVLAAVVANELPHILTVIHA